jgi:hypothetical protein
VAPAAAEGRFHPPFQGLSIVVAAQGLMSNEAMQARLGRPPSTHQVASGD